MGAEVENLMTVIDQPRTDADIRALVARVVGTPNETPFGVSGSPLVVGDKVLLHPGFPKGPRLVALTV